jgi:hypothetical protein
MIQKTVLCMVVLWFLWGGISQSFNGFGPGGNHHHLS